MGDPFQELAAIKPTEKTTNQQLEQRVYAWNVRYCSFRDATSLRRLRIPLFLYSTDAGDTVALVKHAFLPEDSAIVHVLAVPVAPVPKPTDKIVPYTFSGHRVSAELHEFVVALDSDDFLGSLESEEGQQNVGISGDLATRLADAVLNTTAGTYELAVTAGDPVYVGYWQHPESAPNRVELVPNYSLLGVAEETTQVGDRFLRVRVLMRGGLPVVGDSKVVTSVPLWSHDNVTFLGTPDELNAFKQTRAFDNLKASFSRLENFFFEGAFSGQQGQPIRGRTKFVNGKSVDVVNTDRGETLVRLREDLYISVDSQASAVHPRDPDDTTHRIPLEIAQRSHLYGFAGVSLGALRTEKRILETAMQSDVLRFVAELMDRNDQTQSLREEVEPEPVPVPLPRPPQPVPTEPTVEEELRRQVETLNSEKGRLEADLERATVEHRKLEGRLRDENARSRRLERETQTLRQRVEDLTRQLEELRPVPAPVPAPRPVPVPVPVPAPAVPALAALRQRLEDAKARLRKLNEEALRLRSLRRDPGAAGVQERNVMEQISGVHKEIDQIGEEMAVARGSTVIFPAPSPRDHNFLFRPLDDPSLFTTPFDEPRLPTAQLVRDTELAETHALDVPLSVSFYTSDGAASYASVSFSKLEPLVVRSVGGRPVYSMSYGFRFTLFDEARRELRIPSVEPYHSLQSNPEGLKLSRLTALVGMPGVGVLRVMFGRSPTTGTYELTLPDARLRPPRPKTYHLAVNLFNQPDGQFVRRPVGRRQFDERGKVVISLELRGGKLYPVFMHVVREWHPVEEEEEA